MSTMKRTLAPEQTVDVDVEPKRAKTITPEEDASMPAETTCTESPVDTVTAVCVDKTQEMVPVPTQPAQVVDIAAAAIAAPAVEGVETQPHREAVHSQASTTEQTTQEALPLVPATASEQTVTDATTTAGVLPPVHSHEAEKAQDADAQLPKTMQLTESERPAVVADAESTQTTAENPATETAMGTATLEVQESVNKATQPTVDAQLPKTTQCGEQPKESEAAAAAAAATAAHVESAPETTAKNPVEETVLSEKGEACDAVGTAPAAAVKAQEPTDKPACQSTVS